MRAAGLEAGAGAGFAAERLGADDSACHGAVDVEIADAGERLDLAAGAGNAAVQAHGEAIAKAVDGLDGLGELAWLPGGDVEDGAEPFVREIGDGIEPNEGGGDVMAGFGRADGMDPAALHRLAIGFEPGLCGSVDDWWHVGHGVGGGADDERVHGAFQHGDDGFGDLALDDEQAQGRAALAGGTKGRGDDIADHLLGQCC